DLTLAKNRKYPPAHTTIDIDGQAIPVKLFMERRMNVRFSVGSDALIIRVPSVFPRPKLLAELQRLQKWATDTFAKHPEIKKRFIRDGYEDGDRLLVGGRQYTIVLVEEDRKTNSARLDKGRITLKLNRTGSPEQKQEAIRTLLSRVIGQDFHPWISEKVKTYNERYFQQQIGKVFLKHNKTNWGSCSSNSNINLSTRLLFAPEAVIDYVIVHELAHLVEFNHSPRFWNIVESIIPNYQEQEQWLKDHGSECNF
ncbi:MAG: M48 family metallopeptidase, partial [Phaeodactylibacter sp.]|nr:M48 family metallopeptidase [Phaeodactylibacter sp.]